MRMAQRIRRSGAFGSPLSSAIVFATGHSLTDNPLLDWVEDLADAAALSNEWNQQIVNGSPLRPRTAGDDPADFVHFPGYSTGRNRVDEGMSVIAEFLTPQTVAGPYDVCFIAEGHKLLSKTRYEDAVRHLRHFHDRFIDGNPSGRSFYYNSWDEVVDPTNLTGWIAFNRAEATAWQCLADRVNYSLSFEGRSDRVLNFPAGAALAEMLEAAIAGDVPGISGTQAEIAALVFTDTVHLEPPGVFFMAACVYAATYRRSPAGLWRPDGLAEATADALTAIAWEYIQGYYTSYDRMTLAELRAYMTGTFCAASNSYTELPMADCAAWLAGTTYDNPLYFDAATDADYWFAPPTPVFTTQPSDQSIDDGETATITFAAASATATTYQVQSSADGVTWANVSGATSSPYETAALSLANDGLQLRVLATNAAGTSTSDVAEIAVEVASGGSTIVYGSNPGDDYPLDHTTLAGATAFYGAAEAGLNRFPDFPDAASENRTVLVALPMTGVSIGATLTGVLVKGFKTLAYLETPDTTMVEVRRVLRTVPALPAVTGTAYAIGSPWQTVLGTGALDVSAVLAQQLANTGPTEPTLISGAGLTESVQAWADGPRDELLVLQIRMSNHAYYAFKGRTHTDNGQRLSVEVTFTI